MDEVKFGSAQPMSGEAHLTISYEIRKIDLFAAHLFVVFRHRLLMLFIAVLPIPLIWSTLSSADVKTQPMAVKVITAIVIYVAFSSLFFVWQTLWALVNISFRKHRGVLGRHALQITDEGLVERTDVNEAINKWAGLHKIVSGPKYLYIYVTEMNAHMVPKRYFTSHGIEGFEGELRSRIDKAQRRESVRI
jgi:hypothetical protein